MSKLSFELQILEKKIPVGSSYPELVDFEDMQHLTILERGENPRC